MKRSLHLSHFLIAVLISFIPVSMVAQHPLAKRYREQSTWIGRAEPGMQMRSMLFAFQLQNQQELERLLQEQQDPQSPNYHRWLTPEEFGSRFGVPQAQYQRAVQWLEENGFAVRMQLGNRLRIYFDGVAQDVERAFRTHIQLYDYKGKTYFSNDLDPQIPLEFQDRGLGIFGLDDFPKEQPLFKNGNTFGLAPTDAHVAYNLQPLFQSSIDGTGQSIAIVARTNFNLADVQSFRSTFGLPPNDPVKIFVGSDPGDLGGGEESEVLLDTEWSGAIARNATIQVVIAPNKNIQASMDYILNNLFTTRVMSISFGLGESAFSTSAQVNFISGFFSQAAAQGQTALVASGDEGALQAINNGNSTGLDINYLCASPYVVCVGGTTLVPQLDGTGTNVTGYNSETVWTGSGGGSSRFIDKPSYQVGPGVPITDGKRDVPDVAATANPQGGAFIFVRGKLSTGTIGGTSLSAPIWAGVFALVNQASFSNSPGGVGWANPRLYRMGQIQYALSGPQFFNDVTVGNNNNGTVIGFNAGPGYDQVTGWGSFNGDVFVRNFSQIPAPPTVPMDTNPQTTGTIPPANSATECTLNPTQYTINVPAGAVQLVVTLDGPPGGDVDLYVRKALQVGNAGSFNPFVSDYRSEGSTAHEAVYVGPNSPNPLTPGTYYIGVTNCGSTPGAFTLSANVITGSAATKVEELSVDNGIVEFPFPQSTANGTMVVNRLRPLRYPSKLTKFRIYSTQWSQTQNPVGQTIRLIAFADPSGSGNPPSPTPQILVSQQGTIPGSNGFMEFDIPAANQPVIQSGDWYVGFQHPSTGTAVLASINTSGVSGQASFISADGGSTFAGPYILPSTQESANFMIRAVVESHIETFSTVNLQVPPVGASTVSTNRANTIVQAGYGVVTTNSGIGPFGTAVFTFSQNNVVVSEAGVPSSPPTTHAKLFVDSRTGVPAPTPQFPAGTITVDTGVAIVNRGGGTATITFNLRDVNGTALLATGQASMAPGAHVAKFVTQLQDLAPGFALPANFTTVTQFGTLEISSTQPLSILGLRQTTNQRNNSLFTSTPIADLTQPAPTGKVFFPQFADGNGNKTLLILLNTSGTTETGQVKFFSDTGAALVVRQANGPAQSTFDYSIPPGGVFTLQSDGSPTVANAGSVQVEPNGANLNAPVGAGVLGFTQGGALVTESGIPSATPTTRARIFVDLTGGHNTGLAIASPGGSNLQLTLTAFQTDGNTIAGSNVTTLNGNGHTAAFAGQFVPGLPGSFTTGVLEISSASPFVALTLRSLNNVRNDFLITTFPLADSNQAAPQPLIFPQIADSGGFQTQIILLSTSNSNSNVTVNYFDDGGQPIALKSGRDDK